MSQTISAARFAVPPALAMALTLVPGFAAAQTSAPPDRDRFYGSVGYATTDTGQADFGAVTLRAGWKVTPYLGVEAEVGVGLPDASERIPAGGTTGEVKYDYDNAAYAVAFLPVQRHLVLHARAGFGSTGLGTDTPDLYLRGTGESFNYGLGATALRGANGVRADWTRKRFDRSDIEIDAWSVVYVRHF